MSPSAAEYDQALITNNFRRAILTRHLIKRIAHATPQHTYRIQRIRAKRNQEKRRDFHNLTHLVGTSH